MSYGAALWPAFRKILIRIGRWILDKALARGIRALSIYLDMRGEHFLEKAGRARTKKRRDRLRRRARRYRSASLWLEEKALELTARALELYEKLAERIPYHSKHESRRAAA